MCTSNNSIDCIIGLIDTSEQACRSVPYGTGVRTALQPSKTTPPTYVVVTTHQFIVTKYTHRPVQYTTETTSKKCVQ